MAAQVAHRVAKLFNLFLGRFSSAGHQGEPVDVLLFVGTGVPQAFFGGQQVVDVGLCVVVGGLCAPFAVFRASARLGIDDGAHIEFARGTCLGNLVGGAVERLAVGRTCQPGRFFGRQGCACQYPQFQLFDGHNG